MVREPAQIKADIRKLKREMKENGIPRRSCFNGGHTRESLSYNTKLFALNSELERAETPAA